MSEHIPWVILMIISFFFALMLAIGVYHYLLAGWEGEYGYFVAAGELGPITSGFTYLATIFSMFTFLGAVGGYYALGAGFVNLPLFEAVVVLILIPTIAYKFWRLSQRYQFVTPGDLMAKRFDGSSGVRAVFAIAMILSMIIYLTIQYVGIALVLDLMTDGFLSFDVVVGLMFLVGGIYIAIGGMRSVAITDTIQGVLLAGGMLVIFGAIFFFYDPATMSQNAIAENPAVIGFEAGIFTDSWLFWVTQGLVFALGFFLWPQLWVRYYVPDSRRSLGWMAFLWAFFMFLLFFVFAYFIAWSAPTTLAEIPANADLIAIEFTLDHLPGWLAAVILTGGAAAALSSLDSTALVLGSLVSHDLIEGTVVEELTESGREWLSRGFAFLLMFIGALLVWFGPQGTIAELLIEFGYPAMATLFPAVLLSMYWKKTSKWGVILSVIVGVTYTLVTWAGLLPTPYGLYNGFWATVIALAIVVGVSLVDNYEADEEIVDEYGLYPRNDPEIGESNVGAEPGPGDD